jgi:hypothetical protein
MAIRRSGWAALISVLVALALLALLTRGGPAATSGDPERAPSKADRFRAHALARAQIWRPPATPVERAFVGRDPSAPSLVECRFKPTDLDGTTPKFRCVDESGAEIRAKYGHVAEIPAEAAATRLLAALGFAADSVTLVERLRCYGCPRAPFTTLKILEATRTRSLYEHAVDEREYEEFAWVSIERKFDAPEIESASQKGWSFFELDAVDAAKGGAPRAHVDGLRLLAVFLAHWDNKADNQRLVCLSEGWLEGTPCSKPFLMLQDVGSTFGPHKVDLEHWENAGLWEDRSTCTVSMQHMPYNGATFGSARISERGRRFLAGLLGALSDRQLTDLFSGARFDKPHALLTRTSPVSEWVRVFRKRVQGISEGPPCPDA